MSRPGQNRSRSNRSLVPIIGLVVIVVVAVGIALLVAGEDGGDDGSTALATAGITARGTSLPPLPEGGGDDPAVGLEAPTLEGVSPDGTPLEVEAGQPTLLAFLAHWCPHCQAELPRLVDLAEEGELDGLRQVAVLTGTDDRAPNYPPAPWLDREGWTGEVLLDDQSHSGAAAFGLTSYPYLVLVDADGQVVARHAGALGEDGLRAFIDQAP
jgi:cytochrome c biogenesis protein CcmG, thiol:disulfide interchange protein DsbE